ncbi:hypothetical protein GOODEAATRI_002021, partial [Goodea atripinnis]
LTSQGSNIYIYSNLVPCRYFLLCVNYFFYGETVTDYFFTLVQREEPLRILSKYHRFISFALYLTGMHGSSCLVCLAAGGCDSILSPKKTWEGFIGGFFATIVFVRLYPFQIHSIALSSFASIVGPFGGFFASGFKRAFKIKDFANTIPGHGGIMDRFDCQYLMATFVNVYIASFIRGPNPSKLIQQLLALRPDQQLYIFNSLKAHLTEKGLLPAVEPAA